MENIRRYFQHTKNNNWVNDFDEILTYILYAKLSNRKNITKLYSAILASIVPDTKTTAPSGTGTATAVPDRDGDAPCKKITTRKKISAGVNGVREHYLEPNNLQKVVELQRLWAGFFARTKVAQRTGIKLATAKFVHAHPLHRALNPIWGKFEAVAKNRLCYLKHEFVGNSKYKNIMQSGFILSQFRLKRGVGEGCGINTSIDVELGSDFYTFYGFGSNQQNIITPFKAFLKNMGLVGHFIIDLELWRKVSSRHVNQLVLKGEDWGDRCGRIIQIPGSCATIAVDFCRSDKHSPNSLQVYTYKNPSSPDLAVQSGITYAFTISDEIALGHDYRSFISELIRRHLDHLPEAEHAVVLGSLLSVANDEVEFQHAVDKLLSCFYQPEASVPGSMPLMLEYVTEVKTIRKDAIELAPLRLAVERGDLEGIKRFFSQHPSLCNYLWIVKSIQRISTDQFSATRDQKYVDVLSYVNTQHHAVLQQEYQHIQVEPEEVYQIRKFLIPLVLNVTIHALDLVYEEQDGKSYLKLSNLSKRQKAILRDILGKDKTEESPEHFIININNSEELTELRDSLLTYYLKHIRKTPVSLRKPTSALLNQLKKEHDVNKTKAIFEDGVSPTQINHIVNMLKQPDQQALVARFLESNKEKVAEVVKICQHHLGKVSNLSALGG